MHTHCDFGSCSLVLHSVFLSGNCWFQTGSIKDETTFALISLWCLETYLQSVLLAAACIDMHHAQCSVLAGKNHYVFLPRLFPLDKQTHSGLWTLLCVGYAHLIGSQNNSREEGADEFIKFSTRATRVRSEDWKHGLWTNTRLTACVH